MLGTNRGLLRGVPTLVGESIIAVGTDQVRQFSIINPPSGNNTVRCQLTGTTTLFNGNLESSVDGGTTWSVRIPFDFITTPIFEFNATPGVLYRFNVGSIIYTVEVNIYATLT